MAGQTVKLTFQVSDDGTLKVLDDANAAVVNIGKHADESATRADRAFTAIKTSAAAAAVAIGAAVAGGAAVVRQQINQIDEIGLMARNLGLSAQELSGLSVAAELANVQLSELGRAMGILSTKINDARQGGASKKLFDELGIDVSSGRSATEVLFSVADAFSQMDDKVQRTAASRELFAKGGIAMVEVLSGGSAALQEQITLADRLGLTFNDVHAILADGVNDDLDTLAFAVSGTAREITIALLPTIEATVGQMTDWVIANREVLASDMVGWVKELTPALVTLAQTAATVGRGLMAVKEAASFAWDYVGEPLADTAVDFGVDLFNPSLSTTQQSAARRYYARGMTPGSLGDMPGQMSSMMGGVGGVYTGEASTSAPAVERSAVAAEKFQRHMADAAVATRTTAAAQREVAQQTRQVAEEANVAAAEVAIMPTQVSYFVDEIDRAEVAVIDLGATLSDSLTSAMDNLIASGKFDLAGLFTATSRTLTSRVFGGMIESALGGITIPANPFSGLGSMFSSPGAARVSGGQVTGGMYGGGMSFDPAAGGMMTSAATGEAVFVPSGMPPAATGSGFNFAGAAGGGLAGAGVGFGLGSALGIISSSEEQVGAAVGSAVGMAAGAAIGTVLLPGIGTALGAAVGGLVGALGGGFLGDLFESKPNKDQATRMAADEAFKDAGIFPTLALSKEPPSQFKYASSTLSPTQIKSAMEGRMVRNPRTGQLMFGDAAINSLLSEGTIRPATAPGYVSGYSAEIEALGVMLGLEGSQVEEKLGRNLGIRADILGLSDEQFGSELRGVAQSTTTLPDALKELNFSFLRNAIDGKDASFTQAQYDTRLAATINLLVDDLPKGVDAVAIALQNMDHHAHSSVVNIDRFAESLTEFAQVAQGLQGGLRGAGGTAITGLLTGAADPLGDFRTNVLNSLLGAVTENTLNSITGSGPYGELMSGLTSALQNGDPAAMEAALAMLPAVFDQAQAAVARFLPVFEDLIAKVDGAASRTYTIGEARAGRQGALDMLNRVRFSGMSEGQQTAELQRRMGVQRAILDEMLDDGIIDEGERPGFESTLGRYQSNAEALFGQAQNFLTGSPMNRQLRQQSESALGYAVEAWDAAIQVATVGDMSVKQMNVTEIRIDTRASLAVLRAAMREPEGRRIVRDTMAGS